MKLTGKVLWWDQLDGIGVLLDQRGNEYWADSSHVLTEERLRAKDDVSFHPEFSDGLYLASSVERLNRSSS